MDLLEHEVGVAALLRHVHIPNDVRDARLERIAGGVVVLDGVGGEARELAVAEHHHVACCVDDRDDVGPHVAAVLAAADDDGAVFARDDDGAGLVGAYHRQAVGAHDMGARLAHGGQQVATCADAAFMAMNRLLDEMSEHLGVGVAFEMMAEPFQPLAQLGEVLDDTVVHHRDAAVARHMGMRVGLAGAAVRRPARVADAAGSREIEMTGGVLEAFDLALAVEHLQAAVLLDCNARRVVAAVLKALEAFDEDVLHGTRSGVADNAAHGRSPIACRVQR